MRILVVEDEELLAEAVATGLRRHGHAVDIALDGDRAVEAVEVAPYDVVVLDRDLPLVSGDDVCRHLQHTGNPARILMMTAAGDIDDRVEGLALGADDYLPKPFAFRELVARVEALGRRVAARRDDVIERGPLRIDVPARSVTVRGDDVELTPKEFGVLVELARADGAWLSAERLLDRVWDENADPFTSTVRITMTRLRRKLGDEPLIETQRGVGYRLVRT